MTDVEVLARLLPGYEIGAELGRGGFGVVLAGRHKQLGRAVAIKELPPNLAGDAAVRSRFVAEARLLASLDHPHVVPVYDYVEKDGVCALVMEALTGGTVWGHFTTRGYPPAAACALVMVACSGLHHAHQHGILHRDVKPENLLLTDGGQLKVADFGIAKVLGNNDALATQGGDILGTPAYMAPEQAQGTDLGPTADVYAAGVMLYELLSGALPFSEDGGGLAIVYRHVHEQPKPLRDVAPTVPAALADVVMRAIARNPSDRYASAEELAVAIGEAAGQSFGPGWLEASQVPVLGGGAILASTKVATAPLVAPPPQTAARPLTVAHVRGDAAKAGEVVPVRQVLANPPRPLGWAAAALVGVAAVAGLALTPPSATLPPRGQVTVNGVDAATTPAVDLGEPVVVRAGTGQVTLGLKVAGIPLGTDGKAPSGKPMKLGSTKLLAAGTVDATATLADGKTVAFPLRSKRNSFTTVPGVASVVVLLFLLAYAESQIAPLRRRGRRRLGSLVGLAIAGAGLGALASVFVWLLGSDPLTLSRLEISAAAGAATGVLAGVTAYKQGRRQRLRRIARLQGLKGT